MSELRSLKERFNLVLNLLNDNETEKALQIAEDTIAEDPENGAGYVLLGHYYSLTNQPEEAKKWMEEAIAVDPGDAFVLESVVRFYQLSQIDRERWKELTKIGFEQYPDDAFYHFQFGLTHFFDDMEEGLKRIQEAARMDPHNGEYLVNVARCSFLLRKWDLYETYERRTLEEDPENANYLSFFADIAYKRGKFNKAIHFIKEAIRIEPDSKQVRDRYQEIYPATNGFVRLKRGTNWLVKGYFTFPFRFLKPKEKNNHPVLEGLAIFSVMFAILFTALFALTGKYAFYIIGGFTVWSIISGRVGRAVLKKVGFKRSLEQSLDSQNEYRQRKAILEMKHNLDATTYSSAVHTETASRSDEGTKTSEHLEEELAKVWEADSENIEEIKAKQKSIPKEIQTQKPEVAASQEKKTPPVILEYPKESKTNYGAFFVVIAVIFAAMIFRYYPHLTNQQSIEPVDEELQEYIQNNTKKDYEEFTKNVKEMQESADAAGNEEQEQVDQFLQTLNKDEIDLQKIESLSSSNVTEHLEENWEASYVDQLANASVTAVKPVPDPLASEVYVYVTNEVEDFEAVIALEASIIQSVYVEGWDHSQAYQEDIQEKLGVFKQ